MKIISVFNTCAHTALSTSTYKLTYLLQQPYQVDVIIVIHVIDEETETQRSWAEAGFKSLQPGSIICTPTPGILLSLVTNLLGNDLCPSSPHWTVSSRRAETIYVFFHYYIPNAQPRTKLSHCKLHILPRVIPLLRGRAGFQPRTTLFQSPSNFYLGWRGSVDWVPACEPKGHWFYSQSGHMPGLQARSPVGGMGEATTHECFSPYFVPFPSL